MIPISVTAAVSQIVSTALDQAHALTYQANAQMIFNDHSGLLLGPYNPGYATDTRGRH